MNKSVSKGDYAVVQTTDENGKSSKPILIKVKSTSGSSLIGRLEKDPHIVESSLEFKPSDVMVNLGPEPSPGKVYGFDLSQLYLGSKEHEGLGDVHFFTRPDKETGASLWKGFDKAVNALKSHGLSRLPSKAKFELEVYPKRGKYAGMYIHSKNFDKAIPRIHISAGEKTIETASIASYAYVVVHELAHAFDFQFLSDYPDLTAKWIELYLKSVGPLKVTPDDCQRILDAALGKEGSLREFQSDIDDDDRVKLKLIVKWVKEQQGVLPYDLDQLFTHRSKRSDRVIRELWPRMSIRARRPKPLVTEYACLNRRELFAEAFSFHVLNKELPSAVSNLVEESIQLGIKQMKA